jgi:putative SOS response-associated peptidase YedK
MNTLQATFPWLNIPEGMAPRYNIAPSQPVAVVPNDGKNTLDFYVWGLVPFWAKDPQIGNRMINARAETLAEKPSFKTAFRRRRCLVLADGFYEWQRKPIASSSRSTGAKTPMYIKMTSGEPFAFAGLWETWNAPDGSRLISCNIITTEPNELVSQIHNRMPVILPTDAYQTWLDPHERAPSELSPLLKPYPADQMVSYPVSKQVNNPTNDLPTCIQEVQE